MWILGIILIAFRTILRDPTQLALENLAMRQQLAVLKRSVKRPRVWNNESPDRRRDRGSSERSPR